MRTLRFGNTPIHLASAANRLDAMEELVAQSPDSVNLRNAAGHTPSEVAGCETARDMVMPFKKAVNTVRAALRFGNLGKMSPGGGLFNKKGLSSKLVRSPTQATENGGPDTSNVSSPPLSPAVDPSLLDLGKKMRLGSMGAGTKLATEGDTTPTKYQEPMPAA